MQRSHSRAFIFHTPLSPPAYPFKFGCSWGLGMDYTRTGPSSSKANMNRADPSTINNKFLVGYQGWFTCPGDGTPITVNGWSHWFKGNNHWQPMTDLWPDVSQYPPSELFPVNTLMLKSGEHPRLFSSRIPGTVHRHFHWMAQSGVDGAFLQRPLRYCIPTTSRELLNWRDDIGRLVRVSAELEHRVFAVMYDVNGIDPSFVRDTLRDDWDHLIQDEHILDSPSYLREDGRAVVCLWGFGFASTNHDPETVKAVISHIRRTTPGGAYIIAGVPSHWRTSNGDADPSPAFLDLWLNEFDAISPWTVGCYNNNAEADEYAALRLREDLRLLYDRESVGKWRHVDYIPVVFPGCSGYNTSRGRRRFNSVKRDGGSFLWRQIHNACGAGVSVLYGASWDEYDKGTALMPAVAKRESLPVSHRYPLMSLDEDGYDIPSDWYMRICGLAKDVLCGRLQNGPVFPLQGLLDYWETRSRRDTTGSLDLEEEQSPPPYFEITSNPLSCYSTTLLLQELQLRQRDFGAVSPRLPPPSRPLPAIPINASTKSGPGGKEPSPTNPLGPNVGHNPGIEAPAGDNKHSFTAEVSKKVDAGSVLGLSTSVSERRPRRDQSFAEPTPAEYQPNRRSEDVRSPTPNDNISLSPSLSKKQRREELAKELKRREKEAESQKAKARMEDSAKRRPRRDPTVCLFGTFPDPGQKFTM